MRPERAKLRPEGPRPRMRPAASAAKPSRRSRHPAYEGHEGETFVQLM